MRFKNCPGRINGHTKRELEAHLAGKYIPNPEELPVGCGVVVFEKGTKDFWQFGCIEEEVDGKKFVNCFDEFYDFDQVEVYLNTRYA